MPQSPTLGAPIAVANFLSPADVLIDVDASDKERLLWDLSHRAAFALMMDGIAVSSDILKREALGSTGVGRGIALPHARIADLKRPFGILARLKTPVDFQAIDGQPVDIVFLLLLPATSEDVRSNALASVARKLRDSGTVGDIRRGKDAAELYRAMITDG